MNETAPALGLGYREDERPSTTALRPPKRCDIVEVKIVEDDRWFPAIVLAPSTPPILGGPTLARPELKNRIDVEIFGIHDPVPRIRYNVPYGTDGYGNIAAWRWPPES